MLKHVLIPLIALTITLHAQYVPVSPYLIEPERAIGYVDSSATFWFNSYDNTLGGFWTNVGKTGNVTSASRKNMLTQSRNAYGMVRAYMLTGKEEFLTLARGALDFMYEHAWDAANGGWYGELRNNGVPVNANANKGAFDQHYALLGISAYYEATNDTTDWHWLQRGYQNNEDKLWDDRENLFGYYDYGSANWAFVDGKSFNATIDAVTTHLLSLYLMTEDQVYLDRLHQMADNSLTHLIPSMDGQAIGMVEKYDADWNWNNGETLTIMGHILKTAWCLGRIHLVDPNEAYLDGAKKLVEEVWTKGYDHDFGGPYKDYNRTTGEMILWGIPDSAKAWWQMEQALTAGLEMYHITGDDVYLQMADETLDFFMKYFVDHENGEVFADRTRYGDAIPQWGESKGGGFKAAYHSIELGYYTYLYGNLFYNNKPVTLHYNFTNRDEERSILLTPLAVSPGFLRIKSALKDGQQYTDFEPDARRLNIASGEGGHFQVTFETAVTGIGDAAAGAKPEGFALHQNYPNPFNPETTIEYELTRSETISLVVYNISGQKIRILLNGSVPAGRHQIRWNGQDDLGNNVTSGIYFLQMTAGEFTANQQMLLIR